MEKRFLQLGALALICFSIWHFWDPLWKYNINEAVDKNSTEKLVFEVEKGESAKSIANGLDDKDLLVDYRAFLRTVKSEELDNKLRYGKFVLSQNMTTREIVTILTTQGTGELALTIKEGATIDEIDGQLAELGLIKAGDFRLCSFNCVFTYDFLENDRSLEGFLFPDTYFLDSANFSSETLINQMLRNFDSKFTEQMEADLGNRSIRDVIKVASMVEKEVNYSTHPNDAPLVAGIIWKRLDNDWTLGIDATLLYMDSDGKLSSEDLASTSPYNTRVQKGLTPTAISNPGIDAIIAAIYPKDSAYWFYLTATETGDTIFSTTNEEHEANKSRYL